MVAIFHQFLIAIYFALIFTYITFTSLKSSLERPSLAINVKIINYKTGHSNLNQKLSNEPKIEI